MNDFLWSPLNIWWKWQWNTEKTKTSVLKASLCDCCDSPFRSFTPRVSMNFHSRTKMLLGGHFCHLPKTGHRTMTPKSSSFPFLTTAGVLSKVIYGLIRPADAPWLLNTLARSQIFLLPLLWQVKDWQQHAGGANLIPCPWMRWSKVQASLSPPPIFSLHLIKHQQLQLWQPGGGGMMIYMDSDSKMKWKEDQECEVIWNPRGSL